MSVYKVVGHEQRLVNVMRQMGLGKIVLLVVGSFIPVRLYMTSKGNCLTALFSEASLPYLLVDCGFLAI